MIVNWSEGKQGSGSEGDEVLWNTGGLSFVLSVKVDEMLWRPEGFPKAYSRADLRSKKADMRPEKVNLRLERAE